MNELREMTDDERIEAITYIGRQIDQRLTAISLQLVELKKQINAHEPEWSRWLAWACTGLPIFFLGMIIGKMPH